MSEDDVFIKEEITLPISGQQSIIKTYDGMIYKSMIGKNKSNYDFLAIVIDSINGVGNVTSSMVKDLLIPDQEAIAIKQCILNYGDLEFLFNCPFCRKDSEQVIDLETLEIIPIHPDSSGAPDPIITIKLPKTKKMADVGMLTGHKEETLNKLRQNQTLDANHVAMQALRSLDGNDNFSYSDVVKLAAGDHKAIAKARRKLIAGYDTKIAIPCPDCGEKTRIDILALRDFWMPGG